MMKSDNQMNQGVLFEENYLLRTLGGVAKKADVALTELVANAWDAGASRVDITLPQVIGDPLVIEDDGAGMTKEQFHERWMKLGYNRLKHQGEQVSFPQGHKQGQRVAYGRNGIGRHGLLCFNNQYVVETGGAEQAWRFTVTTEHDECPLFVSETEQLPDSRIGTRLQVRVNRNYPHEETIKEIIGARFLHDPQFKIVINGDVINLEDHKGFLEQRVLKASKDISLEVLFFDATKAARHTRQQGVAFWVSGRLVGEPSWVLGGDAIIDGRSHFAKRYTFIVKSNDLGKPEFIKDDWTGFNDVQDLVAVHEQIENYVTEKYREVSAAKIKETSNEVLLSKRPQIEKLSSSSQVEIKQFIESVTAKDPAIRADSLAVSVSAMIEIEETRDRTLLIQKILQLPDEDVDGLSRLLDDWTVKDALVVLDEIDTRLKVIEAIKKLSDDPDTDELHTLHPLITQARWVFGPEFDTSEYASNMSLKNAIAKVLNITVDGAEFINPRKRPDLVCLSDFTYSVTGLEEITADGIYQFKKILIIELKRGSFEITRPEMDQAGGYVEDFISSGYLDGDFEIKAFVVGSKINEKIQRDRTVGRGSIKALTYGQIVRSAEQRLFRLRTVLNERYDLRSGIDIFNDLKAKDEPMLELKL